MEFSYNTFTIEDRRLFLIVKLNVKYVTLLEVISTVIRRNDEMLWFSFDMCNSV